MNLITRSGWGALPPKSTPYKMTLPAPRTWVHHTAAAMPGTYQVRTDEVRKMQGIQKYHQGTRGWNDIAYSFVIMDSGNVYEGRGWGIVGAHTENNNSTSHGLCFAGNFQDETPTQAALDACRELIAEGIRLKKIAPGTHPTGAHRDTKATACPGLNLYSKMSYLRKPWTQPEPQPEPPEEDEMKRVFVRETGTAPAYELTPTDKGYLLVWVPNWPTLALLEAEPVVQDLPANHEVWKLPKSTDPIPAGPAGSFTQADRDKLEAIFKGPDA